MTNRERPGRGWNEAEIEERERIASERPAERFDDETTDRGYPPRYEAHGNGSRNGSSSEHRDTNHELLPPPVLVASEEFDELREAIRRLADGQEQIALREVQTQIRTLARGMLETQRYQRELGADMRGPDGKSGLVGHAGKLEKRLAKVEARGTTLLWLAWATFGAVAAGALALVVMAARQVMGLG